MFKYIYIGMIICAVTEERSVFTDREKRFLNQNCLFLSSLFRSTIDKIPEQGEMADTGDAPILFCFVSFALYILQMKIAFEWNKLEFFVVSWGLNRIELEFSSRRLSCPSILLQEKLQQLILLLLTVNGRRRRRSRRRNRLGLLLLLEHVGVVSHHRSLLLRLGKVGSIRRSKGNRLLLLLLLLQRRCRLGCRKRPAWEERGRNLQLNLRLWLLRRRLDLTYLLLEVALQQ